MVEGGALEVSEEDMVEALTVAHGAVKDLIRIQEELLPKVTVEKMPWEKVDHPDELVARVKELAEGKISEAINRKEKHERIDAVEIVK
jgi:polyribonucleotide nucleotidyltransferase